MNRLTPLFDTLLGQGFSIPNAQMKHKKYTMGKRVFKNAWVELQHALGGAQITVPNFDYDKLTADAKAAAKEAAAADAAKIAAEAEKKKYEAWLKTNEAIHEQNELAEINGEGNAQKFTGRNR